MVSVTASAAQHLPDNHSTIRVASSGSSGSRSNSSHSSSSGEELVSLEAEITELQRENARVENQMLRLKSDINAMESHLNHNDRVSFNSRKEGVHMINNQLAKTFN